jgi:phosphoribosylformylglycinamidine cyclo-ligase
LVREGLVHGLAHITGGGLVENVPRVLPVGLRAQIDAALLGVPAVFAALQEGGGIAAEEMARTFNCGIGMVAIVAASMPKRSSPGLAKAAKRRGDRPDRKGARGCTIDGPAASWGSARDWSASHNA